MEFFKQQTTIDFMGMRKITACLSALLFCAAIASLAIKGLNWSLDFTGGTQVQVNYVQPANIPAIRQALTQVGFKDAVVQSYGNSHAVLISLAPKAKSQLQVQQAVMSALPGAILQRTDYVGPQVGAEMATKGLLAILVALLGTMIYIALRFEWRFAVGAAIALIHDPLLIVGLFSFFHWEFNLSVLAAVLAVIGYSLNDTIVIYDRIRENFRKLRKETPIEIVNLSINQTLSRTIMTSVTTLVVILSLFIYGGPMIHGFSVAFIIGIIIGTYSSIYIAGALTVALGLSREDLLPVAANELEEQP